MKKMLLLAVFLAIASCCFADHSSSELSTLKYSVHLRWTSQMLWTFS